MIDSADLAQRYAKNALRPVTYNRRLLRFDPAV